MNVVTTKAKGWQKRCWDFAMAGKGFEVTGVEGKHIHFFQELCGAYDAKYKFSPGKFILRFPHSHAAREQDAQETHSSHGHLPRGHVQKSHLLHGQGHLSHTHSAHEQPQHGHLHSTARHHHA